MTTAHETVTSYPRLTKVDVNKVIVGLNNDLASASVLGIQVKESS